MSRENNPRPNPPNLVYSVEKVKMIPANGDNNPTTVKIKAKGTVRSGGWKNQQLIPITHVKPPEDGIWHFYFTADSPEGAVTQDMEKIKVVDVKKDVSDGFKGVRVVAETNYIEIALI